MPEITVSTGIIELGIKPVGADGSQIEPVKRVIRINPTDFGFVDTLYGLIAKLESIDNKTQEKVNKTDDAAKIFDYHRAGDKQMRDAVDAVFGDGFCDDMFQGIRLHAKTEDGLSIIENLVFAVFDHMSDSVVESAKKRNERIAKYTEKYQTRKAI